MKQEMTRLSRKKIEEIIYRKCSVAYGLMFYSYYITGVESAAREIMRYIRGKKGKHETGDR